MTTGPVRTALALAVLFVLACSVAIFPASAEDVRPVGPRPATDMIPVAKWDHRSESDLWSRAALKALRTHGRDLVENVPEDMARWCPGYGTAPSDTRRAFWVGLLSALAEYESTHRPRAVGGGGKWFGLLQIAPATARDYGCRAGTGEALKSGSDNLSCAVRILSETVPRDGVIHARTPRWSGVSADWGPMRSAEKRQDMRNWLRAQDYCQMHSSLHPGTKPVVPESLELGPVRPPVRPHDRLIRQTNLPRFTPDRPV